MESFETLRTIRLQCQAKDCCEETTDSPHCVSRHTVVEIVTMTATVFRARPRLRPVMLRVTCTPGLSA